MNLKRFIILMLKGAGMGAANVIPGVSGGTIALITGIFEELIDSLKSFDIKAIRLLFAGKIKEFITHTNLIFLIAVFAGAILSVFSLALLLQFLMVDHKIFVYAFFFGLILASVYYVGKTVTQWNASVIVSFIIGTAIAVTISFLNPASENDSFYYLILCGVVAICSMILPGLSGSFVLLLLGNYELVMINAVADLNVRIIIFVGIGAVGGLIAFSHFLSWVYKKYRNQTISLLTGFILGSLAVIWPWKNPIIDEELTALKGEEVVTGFNRYIPESFNQEVIIAILITIAGIISIWAIEKYASDNESA
ncbi:MAG: DUF368 domain-containing protein [Bacteroidales bacterium]|nr:DUF368 domain-containing protein [Bacteroidales bacterium]